MNEATDRFVSIVQGPEGDIALDEAALLVAAHDHAEVDVTARLVELDSIAARVSEPTVPALLHHLYRERGLAGNDADYDDPANSMVDRVLDRGLGIPISLGLVVIEVGRRLDLDLVGVGFPAHFLVRSADPDGPVIDPFAGEVLDRSGCLDLLRRIAQPDAGADDLDQHLRPLGPRAVLARLLGNLRGRYAHLQDLHSLVWVLRLRTAIPGVSRAELAQLASALAALARYEEAADVIDELVPSVPDEQADLLAAKAQGLRARLN